MNDNNNSMKKIDRRQLMRGALLGGLGFGAMAALEPFGARKGLFKAFSNVDWGHMDAFTLLGDALQGGPALANIMRAQAEGFGKTAFLDIFMSTSSDPRNYLNLSGFNALNDPFKQLNWVNPTVVASVQDMTVTHPAFADAKVNKYFGDMVLNGKFGPGQTAVPGFEAMVKPIDPSKIAMVSFVSVRGTGVHGQGTIPSAGTVPYIIQRNSNASPIGIAALGNVRVVNEAGSNVSMGQAPAAFVGGLNQLVQPSYYPRAKANNLTVAFDGLLDKPEIATLRNQWLDNLENLKTQVASWSTTYTNLGATTFNPFGTAGAGSAADGKGAAAISFAGDLAKSGLGMISSVGLNTFDFHATDATRNANGSTTNMVHAYVQSGVGLNVWANKLIEAGMDGIAFIRTCSGRNENWVQDSGTVSSIAIIVKGSATPGSLAKIKSAYYGPATTTMFVDNQTHNWDAGVLGLAGGTTMAGSIEGTLSKTFVEAVGKTMSVAPGFPVGKLLTV